MTGRTFSVWVDKVFWYLLVGAISYGVKSLHDLSASVSELNTKIAVVITQLGHQGVELQEHASRLHDLEIKLIEGKRR